MVHQINKASVWMPYLFFGRTEKDEEPRKCKAFSKVLRRRCISHPIAFPQNPGSKSLMVHQKIRQVETCRIFLSKPQAWHIITSRSVVHIISPVGAVSHHAFACIYLRLDDIQNFVLMICNSCGIDDIHGFRRDLCRSSKSYAKLPKISFL